MASQTSGFACAAFLLLNIAAGSSSAFASDNGYYLGIGAGTTSVDTGPISQSLDNSLVANGFTSANVHLDQKSTGYKVLGGYQVNRNFAVEGFYADLGTYNFTLDTTGPLRQGTGDYKATAYGLDLLGIVPVKPVLSVYGRFGIYRRDAKGSFTIAGAAIDSTPAISTNAKFGLGVEWEVAPAIGLRTEWEYYNDKDAPVSELSVGIVSHF